MPEILPTEPSGASDPLKMARPPVAWIGSANGRTTSPSGAGGSSSARFSATVLPVTVSASPWSSPASSRAFITTGTPPTRSRSAMTKRPAGRRSAKCGTRRPMRSKSSMLQLGLGLDRDRQQVQDGVGRAAEGHDDGDGVLERLAGDDRARAEPLLERPDGRDAGGAGELVAARVDRRGDALPGSDMPEGLDGRGHRVRGEHAGARARAGAGRPLQLVQVVVAHLPRGVARRPPRTRPGCSRPGPGSGRAGSSRRRRRRWAGPAGPRP